MSALRHTAVEVLMLTVAGLALGVGANAVRGPGAVQWTKNYFAKGPAAGEQRERAAGSPDVSPEQAPEGPSVGSEGPKHHYQKITFEELAKVFEYPEREKGRCVFVDARRQAAYDEGHIEGAIHCDPYHVQDCIECVLEHAHGAERVVVYCNGGNCEDSIFMCRELEAADVPRQAIFIYPGGWKEWQGKDMPTAKAGDSP